MTTTTTTRGGTRPNAGRPPADGARRRVVCVTLDAAQIEAARRIGGDNISAGVRLIIAEYMEREAGEATQ